MLFKMIWKKRGISQVIATVLLVLITMSAIAIIAGFIVPFVKNSLRGTECVQFREHFIFEDELGYNCYDGNGLHGVSIKARGNENSEILDGFDLVFLKEGFATKASVRVGSAGSCSAGGVKTLGETCSIQFEIPGTGNYSVITYVYNSSEGSYKNAEVYPVVNERVCDMSDSIKLIRCDPSVVLN